MRHAIKCATMNPAFTQKGRIESKNRWKAAQEFRI
jgi:hypothetical protein